MIIKKELYGIYKFLLKDIQEYTNKWRNVFIDEKRPKFTKMPVFHSSFINVM